MLWWLWYLDDCAALVDCHVRKVVLQIQSVFIQIQIQIFTLVPLPIRILLWEIQKLLISYRYITGLGAGVVFCMSGVILIRSSKKLFKIQIFHGNRLSPDPQWKFRILIRQNYTVQYYWSRSATLPSSPEKCVFMTRMMFVISLRWCTDICHVSGLLGGCDD
jgi:hypothetical protein